MRIWRYLTYCILIVVSTLFWLASFESALAKARLWGYRCAQVNLSPAPGNPLNGCLMVGFDCRGGCAIGGIIPHFQCVFGGLACDQVMLVRRVTVPHLPCLPMFGAGGAGCVCDQTVPPNVGPIFLHLPGC